MSEPQIQGWGLDQERPEAEKRVDGVMRWQGQRHIGGLSPAVSHLEFAILREDAARGDRRWEAGGRNRSARVAAYPVSFVTTRFKPDAFLFWHGCRLTRAVRQ
jgi:hypothetical protein